LKHILVKFILQFYSRKMVCGFSFQGAEESPSVDEAAARSALAGMVSSDFSVLETFERAAETVGIDVEDFRLNPPTR
jgi:hypothetical protein